MLAVGWQCGLLGKFAVVQRSLLPELLTAATQRQTAAAAGQRFTHHIASNRGRSYIMMLSCYLQCCNVWQYGELQSIAVLVVCCKARGWGGVQAGWGQHSSVWRQCSAAIGCCRTVQSAPAPPPVHLSTAARTQQQQPHCKFSANLGE